MPLPEPFDPCQGLFTVSDTDIYRSRITSLTCFEDPSGTSSAGVIILVFNDTIPLSTPSKAESNQHHRSNVLAANQASLKVPPGMDGRPTVENTVVEVAIYFWRRPTASRMSSFGCYILSSGLVSSHAMISVALSRHSRGQKRCREAFEMTCSKRPGLEPAAVVIR